MCKESELENVEAGLAAGQPKQPESNERAALNRKNIGNLIFFIINTFFTYSVGNTSLFGTPSNGELSDKYQTIITPNSEAFIIWSVIFMFQGVFTVLQLLPRYRSRPVVQDGVGYWYMITCVLQVGWSFAFGYEVIPLSLVFMIMLWASLMALVYSQYYAESADGYVGAGIDFWFFRFPFAIHGGWITAASALNVSVVVVDNSASAPVQLGIGIVSLAVLHAISVWHLFGYRRPNYVIPCVLSWANGWIYHELQNPNSLIVQTFEPTTIGGVANAALLVAFIILFQVVVRVGFFAVQYARGMSYLHETKAE